MKTSIFIPMALEYDPDEKDSIQKSLGVTENELLSLMMRIGRSVQEKSEEEENKDEEDKEGVFAQDILMEMIKNHELTDNMILYLACFGSNKLWESFADGIFLVLDAEKESRKKIEDNPDLTN